jgi:anaerobic selenocysteine-containing dehydrogenase
MKLTRRGFLKVSAITGVAALGLTGCEPKLDSLKEQKKAYQYPSGKLVLVNFN